MHFRFSFLWFLSAVGLVVGHGASAASAERPATDLAAGAAAYGKSCARCHGTTGRGDGLDAKRFYPKPRDLTLGVYKFRSTASGTPPTDEDLFRVITKGLPGTNMPDWQHLDEAVRWHLIDYLKSLSPVFQQSQPVPVTMAPDPGASRADLAKGRRIYEQLGCAACHGNQGRGNGTSAPMLVDDWGMPIRPANLTQGWSYRGGADPRSVTLRFLTGIDGAGMPSYAEAISGEDAWHLAYYVVSLQEPSNWNMIAHPLEVDGALPTTSDDPRWAKAERTDVRLRNAVTPEGEWKQPPTVRAVAFQAVYNKEGIAFRITWDDPTKDASDRLALVLKPSGRRGDVVSLQAWPYVGAMPLDFCRWGAETGQAGEWVGTGFEPDVVPTPLASAASYEDGRWQLVLQRARQPAAPAGAASIETDGLTALAFVVWDGGNAEARAVSPWVDLRVSDTSQ